VLELPFDSGTGKINILGSYFPSWMVCALVGIASALAAGVDAGVPEFIDRQMELPYGHGAYFYMKAVAGPKLSIIQQSLWL
jgi:hypothetical protein